MESREALVEALTEYSGAVILVSHDMHLLGLVADRLWLVKGGAVTPYTEDLEAYRRMLLAGDEDAKPVAKAVEKPKKASRDEVLALRAEVRKCEERLAKLNDMRDKLAKKLADPELYEDARKGELDTWNKKYAEVMEALGQGRGDVAVRAGKAGSSGLGISTRQDGVRVMPRTLVLLGQVFTMSVEPDFPWARISHWVGLICPISSLVQREKPWKLVRSLTLKRPKTELPSFPGWKACDATRFRQHDPNHFGDRAMYPMLVPILTLCRQLFGRLASIEHHCVLRDWARRPSIDVPLKAISVGLPGLEKFMVVPHL